MRISENLTILFTDIVNYTGITAAQSRAEAEAMLRRHDQLLLPLLNAYGGRRVKTIGDSMLVTFRSSTDAVHCGMAMQDALAEARRSDPAFQELHIRVAIHLGEVRLERNDIYGEPVNVAARLEGMTPGDEVYFSESVYLAMNKAEVPSEDLGEHELKGIPEAVRVYRVPPFQFNRLVATGEFAAASDDLPFAGAHVRREPRPQKLGLIRDNWSRLRQLSYLLQEFASRLGSFQRWAVCMVAVTGVLWSLSLLNPVLPAAIPDVDAVLEALDLEHALDFGGEAQQGSGQLLVAGNQLLAAGELDRLRQLIADRLGVAATDPQALLLRGHLHYAREKRLEALEDYAVALAAAPILASDHRLAKNLVDSLGRITREARPLLLRYASAEVLAALAQRTGESGYHGRFQAARVLKELGRADLIDRYNYALHELRGRSECADRLKAVTALRGLNDPRAIPALHEAMGEGLGGWWSNRCLRSAAREAIKHLESLPPTDPAN